MNRKHLAICAALFGIAVLSANAASAKCSAATSVGRQSSSAPTYVYFDSGSSQLKAAERKKIAEQAKAAKAKFVQLICLTGTADKKGDPKKNQALSVARAQAVASELAKNGIDRKMIETEGEGEPGGSLFGGVSAGSRADRRVAMRFTR